MTNTDLMADVFLPEPRATDDSEWGIVRAVNDDGSYMVQLRGSSALTRCGNYCTAVVGDRVHVVIKKNGLCEVIGRRGGTIGGGGEVVMTVNDASNYVAGKVFAHAGTNEPIGALLCDGREVSRTTYWELFDAIGTTYGAGDGSSTFNLPNIESRTIIGESDSFALGVTGGEMEHRHKYAMKSNHFYGGIMSSDTDNYDGLALWDYEAQDWVLGNIASAQMENQTTNSALVSKSQITGTRYNNTEVKTSATSNMQPYIVMRYFITTGKGDPASGINPADYVIDWKADDNGWFWEKWASGKAVCSCKWTGTTETAVQAGGYGTVAVALPFEFATREPAYLEKASPAWKITNLYDLTASNMTTVTPCFWTSDQTISTTEDLQFGIMVKGTWKTPSASGGTESIAPTIAERFEGIEADIELLKTNKVLWAGAMYMNASQTVTLNEAVSAQPSGVWLLWSRYSGGQLDDGWSSFFVPKATIPVHGGCYRLHCSAMSPWWNMAKVVTVQDTQIVGYAVNEGSQTNSPVTWNASNFVLRYVIGV